MCVSIHAAAWGATFRSWHILWHDLFQSTLPRGEQQAEQARLYQEQEVSIHAPAWGATPACMHGSISASGFQSTLPRGEQLDAHTPPITPQATFQSTLPRGERHCIIFAITKPPLFQSTLPRGERQPSHPLLVFLSGFNPRSRVGSDPCGFAGVKVRPAFQSTLPRGERPLVCGSAADLHISIHAPAWGATETLIADDRAFMMFQSTLPRGERPD